MFNSAVSKRKGVLLLSLIAVLMTLFVGFILWSNVQTHSVESLREYIDRWQPILAGIRWTLIGSFALAWPHLCRWLAQSGRVSNDKSQQLTELRWRITGWLVVIELILGQSVLVKLMALMAGRPG